MNSLFPRCIHILESGEKTMKTTRNEYKKEEKRFSEAEFQLLHPLKIERNIRIL